MQYEQTKSLTEGEFKRLFGVKRQTFDEMVGVMRQYIKLKKTSGSPKLSREDQVLVALQYWRGAGDAPPPENIALTFILLVIGACRNQRSAELFIK